ncbi:unnamed protein product [Urochloa humidicola]
MGKCMRKRAGRAPAAELAQVVVGVRTRSRSAAFASAAAAAVAPAPKRLRKQAAAGRMEVEVEVAEAGCAAAAAAGCYLQLRSRRLFMAAAGEEKAAALPAGAGRSGGASGEAPVVVVPGISRCSSTSSSVDVVVATARERGGGATEARREESDVGSAVSDSAGCGRERREATPSSRPPADVSNEDFSSQALDDHERSHRSSSANVTTDVACRARTPPKEEIEAFFAAAEKAEAERFSAKYNFDFARGLPLDAAGGRFEWTTVASG